MCGIAGIILKQPQALGNILERFKKTLEHRGPDDYGWLIHDRKNTEVGRGTIPDQDFNVGFLHRRLSILDLSTAGWQPMTSPDNRHYIIFNGEIYNYLELRAELEGFGVQFRSSSDTEVLLQAYHYWGKDMLVKLTGMFAFAILDTRDNKVFIARDFFGIKPLFYTIWRDGIAFASEMKALLELPGIDRSIDPQRLYDYLRFGITGHDTQTMLKTVKQLPAAHYLELDLAKPNIIEPKRYWQLNPQTNHTISVADAAEKMREMFLENVKLHLRSDVPVGAALSGGIDSSAIVAAMRQIEPSLDLHTFSFVADDPALSEESYIKIAAKHSNAKMHLIRLQSSDLANDLENLIATQDEPFGSTSIYAQYRVFQFAKEKGIKVMLDGQGADELLGGYRQYVSARAASLVLRGKLVGAVQLLANGQKLPGGKGTDLIFRTIGHLLPHELQGLARRVVGQDLSPLWLNSAWFMERNVQLQMPKMKSAQKVLLAELKEAVSRITLPALLRYEDHNSMAHSIESRVPFLTHQFAEFALSLPECHLIDNQGVSKAVFRKAMKDLVPESILSRKDKLGFVTPERDWLLNSKDQLLTLAKESDLASFAPMIYPQVLKEMNEILAGKQKFDWRVWRWINTIVWSNTNKLEL
jgi:asparagine synthase (glutamine-hydrolysing)